LLPKPWKCWAALAIARRASFPALPGNAGEQYLGGLRQYYVP
jgi:hypothetical protein